MWYILIKSLTGILFFVFVVGIVDRLKELDRDIKKLEKNYQNLLSDTDGTIEYQNKEIKKKFRNIERRYNFKFKKHSARLLKLENSNKSN